jgi:hypothetical protein
MPGSGTLVPPDVVVVVPPDVVVVVPPEVEVVPPEVEVVPPEVLVLEQLLPQQPQFQVACAGALKDSAAPATSEAVSTDLRSIVVFPCLVWNTGLRSISQGACQSRKLAGYSG